MSEDWKRKLAKQMMSKAEGKFQSLGVGENFMRVLPDVKDLMEDGRPKPECVSIPPYRMFRSHRDVGPDKVYNLTCGLDYDTGKGKCWLCKVKLPEVEKTKPDYAYAMRPQDQFLVNASKFNPDDKTFGAAKPWYVSAGGKHPLAIRVGSKLQNERKDYVHPIRGHNICVTRVGTGFRGANTTSYPEVEGDENPTKVPLAVLAGVKDLDTLIPPYDEDKQKRAFYGQPDDEEEKGGRDRGSRRSRGDGDDEKPQRRKAPVEDEYADADQQPADIADEYGEEPAAEVEDYGDAPVDDPDAPLDEYAADGANIPDEYGDAEPLDELSAEPPEEPADEYGEPEEPKPQPRRAAPTAKPPQRRPAPPPAKQAPRPATKQVPRPPAKPPAKKR